MKKMFTVLVVMLLGLTVLMSTGCNRTKYDITGTWSISYVLTSAKTFEMGFTGTRTSGYTVWNNQISGEYSVVDKEVEFVLRITVSVDGTTKTIIYYFLGSFDSAESMSGTLKAYDLEDEGSAINGTWSAEKL